MPTSTKCPCHSGLPYASCCGPYHAGKPVPTALALMRSRYAAYALGLSDYIIATETAPSSKESIDQFCQTTKFIGLTILFFDETHVSFIAHLEPHSFQEDSSFTCVNGKWLFISP